MDLFITPEASTQCLGSAIHNTFGRRISHAERSQRKRYIKYSNPRLSNCNVGGHGAVTRSSDGLTVRKLTYESEGEFYQRDVLKSSLSRMTKWFPRCYSVSKRSSEATVFSHKHIQTVGIDDPTQVLEHERSSSRQTYIKLENVWHNLTNVTHFDIKIGKVHYGQNADSKKIRNQSEKATRSTTQSHGLRLIGAEIPNIGPNGKTITLTKELGYSLEKPGQPVWADIMSLVFPGTDAETTEILDKIERCELSQDDNGSVSSYATHDISPQTPSRDTVLSDVSGVDADQSRKGQRASLERQLETVRRSISTVRNFDSQIDRFASDAANTYWRFPGSSLYGGFGDPAPSDDNARELQPTCSRRQQSISNLVTRKLTSPTPVSRTEDEGVSDAESAREMPSSGFAPLGRSSSISVDPKDTPSFRMFLIDHPYAWEQGESPDQGILDGCRSLSQFTHSRLDVLQSQQTSLENALDRLTSQPARSPEMTADGSLPAQTSDQDVTL